MLDLLGLIALVICFFLYTKLSNLQAEVEVLRKIVKGESRASADSPSQKELASPAGVPRIIPESPKPPSVPVPTARPSSNPDDLERLLHWFSIDWPLKLGALLIILGVAWFITYAFLNNWIGPMGRITLGLATGTLVLLAGHGWLRRSQQQGLILELLGATIMLVTVYAGQAVYHLFPSLVSFAFSLAPMGFIAYSSLVYTQPALAALSLIVGGFAPILTGSNDPNILGLYGYLLALVVSYVWLARYTQWRFLIPTTLLIVSLYSLPFWWPGQTTLLTLYTTLEILYLRFFALTFISVFFLSSLVTILKVPSVAKEDLTTSLGVGLFTLTWIHALVPADYRGLLCLLAAVSFMLATKWVYAISRNPAPVYIYAGTAILLLSVAAGYQFDGAQLVIALAAMAALIPIISYRYLNLTVTLTTGLYFVLPIILSLPSISSSAWGRGVLHEDFLSLLTLVISTALVGLYFYGESHKTAQSRLPEPHPQGDVRQLATVMIILASIYGLVLVWLVSHALIHPEYWARTLTLILYASVGITTYMHGQIQNLRVMKNYGLILTVGLIGWLFMVEIWNMNLVGKIITFLAIGVLLMGSVLVRKRTP